jgi:hypothetical protein
MPLKRARSSDSSKKPSISAKIRCTLTPQGQKNQIKRGKSGRRVQEVDIQIKTEDVDLFDVDEDGNLSFTLAVTQLDDIPEKSEIIRLVQDAIKKRRARRRCGHRTTSSESSKVLFVIPRGSSQAPPRRPDRA